MNLESSFSLSASSQEWTSSYHHHLQTNPDPVSSLAQLKQKSMTGFRKMRLVSILERCAKKDFLNLNQVRKLSLFCFRSCSRSCNEPNIVRSRILRTVGSRSRSPLRRTIYRSGELTFSCKSSILLLSKVMLGCFTQVRLARPHDEHVLS